MTREKFNTFGIQILTINLDISELFSMRPPSVEEKNTSAVNHKAKWANLVGVISIP